MRKPALFVGSSKKAASRKLFATLCKALAANYKVVRWNAPGVFRDNEYLMDGLLRIAGQVDGAVLIFGRDDVTRIRSKVTLVARDNVVLEYGFFVGCLGRRRVFPYFEQGVQRPTDMGGIITPRRKSSNPRDIAISVDEFVGAISKDIPREPRRKAGTSMRDGGIGVAGTVEHAMRNLQRTKDCYEVRQAALQKDPIVFDASSLCEQVYAEGLGRVKRRFATTTFLTSGFWVARNPMILQANSDMLRRIGKARGGARRLFVLTRQLAEEVAHRKGTILHARRMGWRHVLERASADIGNLQANVAEMVASGCAVRCLFPPARALEPLQDCLQFDPNDSELAIYDDARVDVFGGGATGRITSVRVFGKTMHSFAAGRLLPAANCFEALWAQADNAQKIIEVIVAAHAQATRSIEYVPERLHSYDHFPSQDELALKDAEMACVRRLIGSWAVENGRPRRALDVGTCTGRYPLGVVDLMASDSEVVAIDDDPICEEATRNKVRAAHTGGVRIDVRRLDFLSPEMVALGTFDVVTAMLGTLSHFPSAGVDRGSALGSLARQFRSVLREAGILVIGNWSTEALRSRKLLDMYTEDSASLLREWTPSVGELSSAFEQNGLSLRQAQAPHPRIDVLVFGHDGVRK